MVFFEYGLGGGFKGWEGLLLHGCFSLCWIFLAFVFRVDFFSYFFSFSFPPLCSFFFIPLSTFLFLFVLFLFRLIIYVDYGGKEGK
jgi:hypothetical protein